MRFRLFLLWFTAAFTVSPGTFAQSSFGPEISAEDFSQHMQGLAATEPAGHRFGDDAEALRLSYLRYQFTRLGLPTGPSRCGDGHGLQAELEGAENGRGAVVYYALWTDNAQVAGVLEIAERFMTSRPRPAHAVIFRFGAEPHPVPAGCNPAENAGRVIQPEHLPTGDAMALVDKLIALQRQGR